MPSGGRLSICSTDEDYDIDAGECNVYKKYILGSDNNLWCTTFEVNGNFIFKLDK